jgi:hypothetical protein
MWRSYNCFHAGDSGVIGKCKMSYYSDLDDDLGSYEEAERDLDEIRENKKWEEYIFNAKVKAEVKKQLKNTTPNFIKVSLENRFPSRGVTQTMKCHCGGLYEARKADLKRGWALSCSKSCAAARRTYRKPKATKFILEGVK